MTLRRKLKRVTHPLGRPIRGRKGEPHTAAELAFITGMALRRKPKRGTPPLGRPIRGRKGEPHTAGELVIITGMSGSGKASALKAYEDLGYYCVDNLPVELIPRFPELAL